MKSSDQDTVITGMEKPMKKKLYVRRVESVKTSSTAAAACSAAK